MTLLSDKSCLALFGFTLAEVLISLSLLTVIVAFTIPKVLEFQNTQERNSKIKEAIAALYDVMRTGQLTGELRDTTFSTYFFSKLNTLKNCPGNSELEKCWTQPPLGAETNEPGVILPNGVQIVGFNSFSSGVPNQYFNGLALDYNGAKGPNVVNNDQLMFWLCFGPHDCSATVIGVSGTSMKSGTIGPDQSNPANVAFFRAIFNPS